MSATPELPIASPSSGAAEDHGDHDNANETDQAGPWIGQLEFMPRHPWSPGLVERRQSRPIEIREVMADVLSFGGAMLQAENPPDRVVEVNNPPAFVHHQNPVLNGIEECFKE